MAKPTGSPSSSLSPLSKRLSEKPFPKFPWPLEDQGVELGIVLRIPPLSPCPPPSDIGSLPTLA